MVKLAETNNITKLSQFGEWPLIEVPAFGSDNNCGLNAFGLGLLDLILQQKLLLLSVEKQNRFVAEIRQHLDVLRKRHQDYVEALHNDSQRGYPELANDLQAFISFAESEYFSYDNLIHYIETQASNRLKVAVLHVALAPALRSIGASIYLEQLHEKSQAEKDHAHREVIADEQLDAYGLLRDGAETGPEVLIPLAHDFFGINLKLYDYRNHAQQDISQYKLGSNTPLADMPTVHLVHRPAHWNYLLPQENTTGLAAVLDSKHVDEHSIAVLKDETESLVSIEASKAKQFKIARKAADIQHIRQELPDVVDVVEQASKNLLEMNNKTDDYYQKISQAHVQHSESLLRSVRKSLQLTPENIQALRMATQLEKELLLGEGVTKPTEQDQDAVLARALQNTEILSFFESALR